MKSGKFAGRKKTYGRSYLIGKNTYQAEIERKSAKTVKGASFGTDKKRILRIHRHQLETKAQYTLSNIDP